MNKLTLHKVKDTIIETRNLQVSEEPVDSYVDPYTDSYTNDYDEIMDDDNFNEILSKILGKKETYTEKLARFYKKMAENESIVNEIEEKIGKGLDFRVYFSTKEKAKELMSLRTEDTEKFYKILRKEELFLNTCLQTFGFYDIIISLDPDKLLDNIDDSEPLI